MDESRIFDVFNLSFLSRCGKILYLNILAIHLSIHFKEHFNHAFTTSLQISPSCLIESDVCHYVE